MDRPKTKPERRVGNTTRLIDYYIQKLFEEEEITVRDHYSHINAHINLASRIQNRMKLEHPRQTIERVQKGREIFLKLKNND